MPKTYSPFIELTRTDEVEGLSAIGLVNVDDIILIRCLDDGRAQVFFKPGYMGAVTATPQFMIPVENYAYLVGLLTDLVLREEVEAKPAPQPAKTPRKRAKPHKKLAK